MANYYSKDMRVAALKCIKQGKSHADIIGFFGISRKTLSNWVRLERTKSDLEPNKRTSYKKSKDLRNSILSVIKANPDLTLDELAEVIPKHRTTIFYHLKKLGITRKKNHPIRRTR